MSVVIPVSDVSFLPTFRTPTVNKLKYFLLACVAAGITSVTDVSAASSSNTIVRFELRHGQTVWGKMDVELFDHDKPVTVSNFLHYVRSGAFDRSILHRVVPGFIVQGGQYTVPNPYVSLPANYMNRIPEGDPIPSEATNSPVIPNTFGTLAMALSSDGTNVNRNSGTTSWYFNTADNTIDLPEYTVFGKVKSGSKYLTYFNTIFEEEGIINMFSLNYLFSTCDLVTIDSDTDVGLGELPVFYWYFDCPFYSDLFNVQISIIKSVEDGADKAAPKLKIIYPIASTVITNDSLTVTGTVTDNVALDSLRLYLGSNAPVLATVTGNTWSATLTSLPAGTNAILMEATDQAGNKLTATTRFFFRVPLPITILPPSGTGTGITFGITNGQVLDVGRRYTISARPDPGNFFITWAKSNINISADLNYRFYMETGMTLIAQFETNLFPFIKGNYHGLFVSTNLVEQRSSGFLTLSVSDVGAYSGKLLVNGGTIPISGNFNIQGSATEFLFNQPGLPGFTRFNMSIDLLSPDNQLRGWMTNLNTFSVTNYIATNLVYVNETITNTVATNIWVTNTFYSAWTNDVTADRVVFNSKINPAPQAGKYTVVFPSDTNSASGPAGDGYGTVTVNTSGAITFSGVLADGTKAAQKTFLSTDGNWPLYIPLYKTNGSLVSWVNFSDEETTDFSGLFNWFKQAHTAKYYGGGFTNEATILGSKFTPPKTTNQMLFLTNAVVGFTNGNLVADFANEVTLDPKGKVTNQDANNLSFSINSGNGLVSGSVTPPAGGKPFAFKGAILQKGTNAAGFFLGTNASGSVRLGR